ncbi:MAG: ABC transporter [Deltaproteobacteria bacterium 13_1_40CM_4_68_19]|nr:MAG: ABC transporter [Deltaproteobacteria bacterium 13_1_40CM_4_68_19]OLD31832.1 MAG: ABC transporter [Myxococcales bacterium 13_1_40CM_2_68_15]
MSLLHARALSVRYGPKVLLDGASFALGHHDRAGLIGPNGSGKSTLLKILAGQLEPDGGAVQLVRKARAGYLPQELSELPPGSVLDGVLASVPGRSWLQARLAAAEAALAQAVTEEEQVELGGELAELHEQLAHHEELYGRHRAEEILGGLGFARPELLRPASELSGGWKMRAALAALLLQDPELLLLDEPTNHLDVPTLEWFDSFLRRSRKALLLVSHDREFLDRQIDRVLSLEPEGLRAYAGNYERYLELRAAEEERLAAQAEKQSRRRAQMQAFIDRFRAKATKARQVQSRVRLLEKEEIVQVREERATVRFRFPEAPRSGREVARLERVSKSYGATSVFRDLSAQVLRGDRTAVIGLNGAGKTTLLKLLAGEIEPDAGTVVPGHNLVTGYFAQHHTERLDAERTILEEVHGLVPTQPQSWVRGVLGSFLFSGDEVDKRIGVLSGGERARVALARLLVVPSNFLLMDEPTNHLDLDSSEALIDALTRYEGTLLFVSHNRSFVNGLATRIWEVRDGGIDAQPGDLDDWSRRRAEQTASEVQAGSSRPAPQGVQARRERALQREQRDKVLGPIKRAVAELEQRIAQLEQEKKAAEAQLADPALFSDPARSTPLITAYRDASRKLEELYARWEHKSEELAAAESRLS